MFPIELEISSDKRITFKGPEKVLDWCRKELKNWSVLQGVNLPFHGNLYGEIESPISQVETAIANYSAAPSQDYAEQNLRAAIRNLSSLLVESRYVFSDSLLGRHIRSVANDNPKLCAAAYYLAIQPSANSHNFTQLTSMAASFLAMHYLGVSPGVAQSSIDIVEASASSIEQTKSEIENLRQAVNERLVQVESETSERLARVFGLVEAQISSKRMLYNKNRDEAVSDLVKFVREQVKVSRTAIDDFEKFTKDKIALQGPIHYWQSKMRTHRIAAIASAAVLVLYSVVVFCFVRNYLNESYGGMTGFIDSWKNASLSGIGVLGGISAFFLVVARVVYRIFTSQLHLWNDSAERVTMTETYLSLAERGHAREELLGALFSRLFSPASDGIVRDDLGAVSPFDAMSKALSSRSQ